MKFKCQIIIIIVLAGLTILKYLLDANAKKGELRLVWKKIKELLPLIIALVGIFTPVLLDFADDLDKPSFTIKADSNSKDPIFVAQPIAIETGETKHKEYYEIFANFRFFCKKKSNYP